MSTSEVSLPQCRQVQIANCVVILIFFFSGEIFLVVNVQKDNYEAKKDWFMNTKEALKYKVIDGII